MSSVYWNNTRVFEAFAELEKKVDTELVQKRYLFFGFTEKIVAERIAQRFVELCFFPYAKSCAIRFSQSKHPLPDERRIELGGLYVDQQTGNIRLTAKFLINCIVKFCFLWLRLVKYIVTSIRLNKPSGKKKISLLFGAASDSIFQNGSDARFIEYLQSGPITPLQESDFTIIYYPKYLRSIDSDNVVYHPLPIEGLIQNAGFGFVEGLSLLFTHLTSIFLFFLSVLKQPLTAVLFSDAAYSRIIQKLDASGVINHVVITNANFQQYTWMRSGKKSFAVHQVYYSQNIKPLVYKNDPVMADYPAYKHIKADEIWVWNPNISNYLQNLGVQAKMHIVDPVVWYLPSEKTPLQTEKKYDIIIFDITPITREAEVNLGVINNYYSTDNLIMFMSDIIQTCKEVNQKYNIQTRLFLKNKRASSVINDKEYEKFISGLVDKGELAGVIDYSTDIFSLLNQTGLSVTIPFSSTSIIAASIHRPAIVYDFSKSLINNYADSPDIYFVSGKNELASKIIQIFELDKVSLSSN